MDKARRRHVPAFGEWNYYYSTSSASASSPADSAAAAGECCWWYAPPEEEDPAEACSDAWFSYSPPPMRRRPPPPKKARRPEVAAEAGHKPCAVANAPREAVRATAAARRVRVRVVRPVDEDLYRVPPPDDTPTPVSRLPRRRKRAARRSLWTGCLGLSCVASTEST